jgi:hypothetical protein
MRARVATYGPDFGSTLFGKTRVPPVTAVSTSGTFVFCNGGKRRTSTKQNNPSSLNTNRISTSTLSTEKTQPESPIHTDEPDGRIELMTEEEAQFRSQPYNQSK